MLGTVKNRKAAQHFCEDRNARIIVVSPADAGDLIEFEFG
jgi:hypothetical protein